MYTLKKRQTEELLDSGYFDPEWYRSTYRDVEMVGIDPIVHYLKYGHLMKRDPGPDFPSIFYRKAFNISDEHEPITRLADLRRRNGVERIPDWRKILVLAAEVGRNGRPDMAVHLAERFLPPNLAYTSSILRANAAVTAKDEQEWLLQVNNYLSHSDVSPIALSGTGTFFDRLDSAPKKHVDDGPLISVLMPAFNAEKTIRMAVRSLLQQSWRKLELLIVDDCSKDQTWSILQELEATDSRVRIFRNQVNVGPYLSKNVAVSQARGKWITGHDADDWAHPERLERQFEFCMGNKLPACMSGMLRISEDGTFVRLNSIKGMVHDGACRSGLISLMVNARYFHDVLGYWDNVRTSGDSEILRRIQHLNGADVEQLPVVTMFCYDNPEGLTNHSTLGYSESGGISPHRQAYRSSFTEAHKLLNKTNSRYSINPSERPFAAPDVMVNSKIDELNLLEAYRVQGVEFGCDLTVDVAIVTNLRFPGGNASSTLDEIGFFVGQGLKVALIHCPVDADLGREVSTRYDPWMHLVVNWTKISKLTAKVVICRHPIITTSVAFAKISSNIHAQNCFIVKNNSSLRSDGSSAYDIGEMLRSAQAINSPNLVFCPISPVMRAELERFRSPSSEKMVLSATDWSPTFDLSLYKQIPKTQMLAPYRIGRHGRDGAEKWFEDATILRQIFPANRDFRIEILGGAKNGIAILGGRPGNWTVHPFGSLEPHDYLRTLDAFVYFPSTGLVEAFGRTIVEAMLAGVPAILPQSFVETFGDLPIYCKPTEVERIVRRLAASDSSRRTRYLSEVQEIAVRRFSSALITSRLKGTQLAGTQMDVVGEEGLSKASLAFREEIFAP